MVSFTGRHHYHKRKRVYENLEPVPHPDKWKRRMDWAILFLGPVGPLMTIPQVLKIWVGHTAAGVSFASWFTYTVLAFFWLAYGVMHKEKAIIYTYILWIIVQTPILVGILMYS